MASILLVKLLKNCVHYNYSINNFVSLLSNINFTIFILFSLHAKYKQLSKVMKPDGGYPDDGQGRLSDQLNDEQKSITKNSIHLLNENDSYKPIRSTTPIYGDEDLNNNHKPNKQKIDLKLYALTFKVGKYITRAFKR